MAKIILIGDTHYDISSNVIENEAIYNNQIKLFKELVFPIMKERGITQILQLGDFTDKRTSISTYIQHRLKEDIFDVLEQENYLMNYIIGNHDMFYTTNRSIYTLEIFEKAYRDNFKVFQDPVLWQFEENGNIFLLVPWICDEDDKNHVQKIIKENNPNMIFGHFEIEDFYLSKTMKDTHGLDKNYFKGVPVISGHYHLKQETGNIIYAGTPTQTTWEDFSEDKGIYILDTETLELEFIPNDYSMKHIKVYLDSVEKTIDIVGFDDTLTSKITSKTSVDLLEGHKIKIFIDKDNAFNKKMVDKISEVARKIKVEVLSEETDEESDNTEINTDFNIKHSIHEKLDSEYQKEVFEDIYKKAEKEVK